METVGEVAAGGALIGLALAMLMILTGRVMSGSAMIGSLLGGREGLAATSIAFIAGLFIAPSVLIVFGAARQPLAEENWLLLGLGGLLVGIGARLGNSSVFGAVFGLSRRSGRAAMVSLAILAGVCIAVVLRHFLQIGGVA